MKSLKSATLIGLATLAGFILGHLSRPTQATAQGTRHMYVQEVPTTMGGISVYGSEMAGFSCAQGKDGELRCFALTVK